MKKLLENKWFGAILAVWGGLAVAALIWYGFGGREWYTVRNAIREIASGNKRGSIAQLEGLNDRAYVLKKLEDAVESQSFNVEGKTNLLFALVSMNQHRALRRALDSKDKDAQRAACGILYTDQEMKSRCSEIALEWLKDERGDNRQRAAMVCASLNVPEAQPVFLEIASRDPKSPDDLAVFRQALAALKDPKPPAMVERLLQLAADSKADIDVRAISLEALQRMKDGPRDRILPLLIATLSDTATNDILRSKAALGLRDYPEDRAWQALEAVLLSEKEEQIVVQRNCLYTLGMIALSEENKSETHIDRLKQLLLDRRVYHHRYFGIRVDVAIALATLNVREGITLDIMCDYLVDEDGKDKDHIVRQEGWLTLWVLTGAKFENIPELAAFKLQPQAFQNPKAASDYLFSRRRPGITAEQSADVAKLSRDLAKMQEIRQIFTAKKGAILSTWKAQAEAAEAARQEKEKKETPPGPQGPQGPVPPGKEEGSGEKPKGAGSEEKDAEGSGEPGDEKPKDEGAGAGSGK